MVPSWLTVVVERFRSGEPLYGEADAGSRVMARRPGVRRSCAAPIFAHRQRRAAPSRSLWQTLVTLAILGLSIALSPAGAVEPDEILQDPALEARARALSAELRCLVCQNQSIDDSNAPLARDLRLLVRERLKAGDTDEQVLDFVVDRYGEFALLNPRFSTHTLLLWLGPPAVLLLTLALLLVYARRAKHSRHAQDVILSEVEEAKLRRLLDADRPSASASGEDRPGPGPT